ncbi:MAG: thiol:disulfide interchange protein [Pimelobacter sp.]|nr:thiol:disulfide interchange protein [Pimelobacter sp.]
MSEHAGPTGLRRDRRNASRAAALALLLMLGLAACGTDTPATPDPGARDSTRPASSTPAAPSDNTDSPSKDGSEPEVAPELEFTGQTLDGEAFDGTTLAGKDTVLWFWAPWCTECRREAPYVAAAQADNPNVEFVGIAGLGETDDMRDFVEDYDVAAFEHLADLDGSLWQRFGVVQQPAYAFIDDTGTVEVLRGELGEAGMADNIATLTGN